IRHLDTEKTTLVEMLLGKDYPFCTKINLERQHLEFIKPYQLTPVDKLQSLVEHRSKFSLDFCELNLFETRQKAEDFHLKFNGFTVTSMLRGKKLMHLDGLPDFEYVPGETVLAPPETLMRIDFPDAKIQKPTQCTALVIDTHYLSEKIANINTSWKGERFSQEEWHLNLKELILKNNTELARISTRMLEVLTSNDPFKEYQADLILREMVLCMLKLQNLGLVRKEADSHSNSKPFHAVMSFINTQFTSEIKVDDLCRVANMSKSSFYRSFTDEYGITPAQLILEERMKYAKQLLDQNHELSIKEVAYASGFNDPNYFSRMFRRMEGLTPSEFRVPLLS
ncbi:MAG: helix-turn-helix domain-containing protein, partial [Salibacteraceae bacterium]|nr:helix-turn-helix domain-containing protein [Salibacteraceae bacterium]